MSKQRLYTRQDKQIALACFRAGMGAQTVADRLGFGLPSVKMWLRLYQSHNNDWVRADDQDYELRKQALDYFKQGRGYKFIASALNIPVSRVKYWHLRYRHEQTGFFLEGSHAPKQYSKEMKTEILNRFAVSSESKKAFCGRYKISVGTLNNWLREEKGNP